MARTIEQNRKRCRDRYRRALAIDPEKTRQIAREYSRQRRRKIKEQHPEKYRMFRDRENAANKNPERQKRRRFYFLYQKYGIDEHRYTALLQQQGGGCGICGGDLDHGRNTHIDHDHSCCPGEKSCGWCIRGILCSTCNRGLGYLKDSVPLLKRAIAYLTLKTHVDRPV